jgi:hypothetical protein
MWADRIWPFSAIRRIEGKIDAMTSKAEQIKDALDLIAGHVASIKTSTDALQANLQAAVDAGNADPMLDAALQEADDLAEKTEAMVTALAPHVTVPATPSPAPAQPAPVADPAPAAPETPGPADAAVTPATPTELDAPAPPAPNA